MTSKENSNIEYNTIKIEMCSVKYFNLDFKIAKEGNLE